jgi:hypothetical protein
MARTGKTGIDYFPFDVDFFQDEKVQFVSARFGIKGEAVTLRLLCKIYRNGYYTEWNDDIALLFTKSVGDISLHSCVNDVVFELLKRGFFDKSIFERFSILTSKGIQNRYFEATKRYKSVEVFKELLLVDVSKMINVNILGLNVNINSKNAHSLQQREREREIEREIEKNKLKKEIENFSEEPEIRNPKSEIQNFSDKPPETPAPQVPPPPPAPKISDFGKLHQRTEADVPEFRTETAQISNEMPKMVNSKPEEKELLKTQEKPPEEILEKPKNQNPKFKIPSVEEVQAYCDERKNGISAGQFVNFYQSKGWKIGKNSPMKDWQAAVRTWEYNQKQQNQQNGNTSNRTNGNHNTGRKIATCTPEDLLRDFAEDFAMGAL